MSDRTQTAVQAVVILLVLCFALFLVIMACRSNNSSIAGKTWNSELSNTGQNEPGQTDNEASSDPYSTAESIGDGGYVADEVVVALDNGTDESDALAISKELNAELLEWIPELNVALVRFSISDEKVPSHVLCAGRRLVNSLNPDKSSELTRCISEAQSNPHVRYAEPHYYGHAASTRIVPDDPRYDEQYYIWGTKVDYVWSLNTGNSDLAIAILDTGVDYDHPEFAGRIHPAGKDFISREYQVDPGLRGDGGATPGNGIDDDGDNFTDDGAQHGSRTAGVACATGNNGEGIAGVNWQTKILSLRIDSAVGEINGWLTIDCVRAMMYALSFPEVKVINISAVYPRTQQLLHDATIACYESGKVVVAAAGNAGDDTPDLSAPAYYPECIAVGGTDGISSIWSKDGIGTNYGSFIDVLAPATKVLTINSDGETRTYASIDGTSMSAPLVSGIAAMIIAANPDFTPDDVDKALKVGATSFDLKYPYLAGKLGAGLINCLSAYESPPQVDLSISNARSDGLTFFEIRFNRKLDPVSATNVENYSLSPSSYIYRSVLLADKQTVRIETDPLAVGGFYTVSVQALITADGETQYPDVQQTSFRVDATAFNAASSQFGAVGLATSEFNESHSVDNAIDESTLSYWYAEISDDAYVDLVIKLPQMEWINSLTFAGRKKALSESPYRQICRLYATAVFSPLHPVLEESYSVIDDPSVMSDSKLTVLGDKMVTIDFEPIQTAYVIIRFTDGTDFMLDSDGKSNGVSVRWIKIGRELYDNDFYAPTVYRIIPNTAQLGATIEFLGAKFGTYHSNSKVMFANTEAIIISWSDSRITTLVPYNPLSLPVSVPDPITGTLNRETGDPAAEPGIFDAILPPFENAESGLVYVINGDYQSNKHYFDVITP